jgi:hypothetical protein
MGRRDMHPGFWWESLNERDHFQELCVNRKIILKWIFKKLDGRARSDLMWHMVETSAGSCECHKEPPDSLK